MDVLLLALVTVIGMFGGSWFAPIVAALALTYLSSKRKFEIVRGSNSAVASRALSIALSLSFLNNLIFTSLSFVLGHAVALLA